MVNYEAKEQINYYYFGSGLCVGVCLCICVCACVSKCIKQKQNKQLYDSV